MRIALTILCLTMMVFFVARPASAADDGWMTRQQLRTFVNKLRRGSEAPKTVQCRNASSNPALIKMQYRVATSPNDRKHDWALIAQDDSHIWQPGWPREWKNWRKVAGETVKGGNSGSVRHCSLWYHKTAGSLSARPPAISRKSGAGTVTLH